MSRQKYHLNTIITRHKPIILEANTKYLPLDLELAKDARLQLSEPNLSKKVSITKFYLAGISDSRFIPDINASCLQNELVAILYRVLTPPKNTVNKQVFISFRKHTIDWCLKFKEKKLQKVFMYSFEEWLTHLLPAKRKKYSPHELADFDPTVAGMYTFFVKLELIPKYDNVTTSLKAPRVISEANAKAVAATGPYFYSLSKNVAKIYNNSYKYCYCSGMNALQVGDWMTNMLTHVLQHIGIEDPLFLENDFSTFDKCEHEPMCDLEYQMYLIMFDLENSDRKDERFRKYVRAQKNTHGMNKDKTIEYWVTGTRKSGDNNTSIGNSLINFNMQKFLYGDIPFAIIFLGDDSLTIIDKKNLDYARKQSSLFEDLGYEAKLKWSTNLAEVEFCSSLFLPLLGGKYLLIPKLGRFIAKHGFSISVVAKNDPRGFMREIAIAYSCIQELPLYGQLIKFYLKETENVKPTQLLQDEIYKITMPKEHVKVDPVVLAQFFYDRYGVIMEEAQEELSNTLRDLKGVSHLIQFGPIIEKIIRHDCDIPSSSL